MKRSSQLLKPVVFAGLALFATLASARDIGIDEAVKLRDAGTIQSFETLNARILEAHPNSTVRDTDLDHEWGRYVYEAEVVDAQGQEWELELDAATGEILKNERDY
jgi:uncharacterized membrane protein YkoI